MKYLIPSMAFLFLSCSNFEPVENSEEQKKTLSNKKVDITKLPLKEGLAAKYSKLQYVCSYDAKVTRPLKDGGAETTDFSKKFLLWDILDEFTETKLVVLEYDFANIETKFSWEFSLGLEKTRLNHSSVRGENQLNYKLENPAYLKGIPNGEIVELDENGKLGFLIKHETNNEEVIYDRIPHSVHDVSFGPSEDDLNKTEIRIECILDAEPNAGYEKDFEVLDK